MRKANLFIVNLQYFRVRYSPLMQEEESGRKIQLFRLWISLNLCSPHQNFSLPFFSLRKNVFHALNELNREITRELRATWIKEEAEVFLPSFSILSLMTWSYILDVKNILSDQIFFLKLFLIMKILTPTYDIK